MTTMYEYYFSVPRDSGVPIADKLLQSLKITKQHKFSTKAERIFSFREVLNQYWWFPSVLKKYLRKIVCPLWPLRFSNKWHATLLIFIFTNIVHFLKKSNSISQPTLPQPSTFSISSPQRQLAYLLAISSEIVSVFLNLLILLVFDFSVWSITLLLAIGNKLYIYTLMPSHKHEYYFFILHLSIYLYHLR